MVKYKYFFGSMETLSGATMKKLLSYYGSEYDIYYADDRELIERKILTLNQLDELLNKRKKWDLDKEWFKAQEMNVKVVAMSDNDYPRRLKHITSLPYMLFYKGRLPDENRPSVAIIGARMCSEYGKQMASYFSEGLTNCGVQIISGLASGIDGLAQSVCIEAGGDSYGVLGSGVNICYPQSNRKLYEKLQEKGGIISELPLGMGPLARNFPRRNRIISGLSDLVLVVEAKPKSGTSITVSMALDQGKIVYAVPGRVNDMLSQGCNRMISEGAGIAYCIDNLIDELKRVNVLKDCEFADIGAAMQVQFENSIEKELCEIIKNGNSTIDSIADTKRNISVSEIMAILTDLELKGIVHNSLGRYSV